MNNNNINKEDIAGIECKHVFYILPFKGSKEDYHYVKEILHLKDGRKVPNVRLLKNFKVPYYITKKGCRVHKQKKERELLDRVEKFETTECSKITNIANALEMPWYKGSLRDLNTSPYLYGTDMSSTAYIKGIYKNKFTDYVSEASVACFDTETDLATGSIIVATISFKDKIFTAVTKDFVKNVNNPKEKAQLALNEYLSKHVEERNIHWELSIVDNAYQVAKECFARAHEWKPDFLAIWNMNFDIPKVLKACEDAGERVEDIFCDPSLPQSLKTFRYKQGRESKVMASGKVMPISFADQWHTVYAPASFYVIDAMCTYRKLRVQKGEMPSYGLDYVLNKELGERKLKFTKTDAYSGAEWHRVMTSQYPIEYIIYNVFDCVGMELLDERIKDLALDLPESCYYSDYSAFDSQPKRVIDELYWYLLDKHKSVIGSTGSNMLNEVDKLTPPNTDLIVNLKACLIEQEGLSNILESDSFKTTIYTHCFDLDVKSAYPSNTIVFQVSKETCRGIICQMEDLSTEEMRLQSLNLSGGHTNGIDFSTKMFRLPKLRELSNILKESKDK